MQSIQFIIVVLLHKLYDPLDAILGHMRRKRSSAGSFLREDADNARLRERESFFEISGHLVFASFFKASFCDLLASYFTYWHLNKKFSPIIIFCPLPDQESSSGLWTFKLGKFCNAKVPAGVATDSHFGIGGQRFLGFTLPQFPAIPVFNYLLDLEMVQVGIFEKDVIDYVAVTHCQLTSPTTCTSATLVGYFTGLDDRCFLR